MLVNSGDKKYAIPVYYITEGNPAAQVAHTYEISHNNYNNQLQISNPGDGILLWDIASMPEWLSVDMNQFNLTSLMLGQGAAASIPFILDAEKAVQSTSSGTIVLKTNDKNNQLIEIAVSADLGTPSLSIFHNRLDFGSSETRKTFRINNYGDGILIWHFEGLPDWLSVSSANGMTLPHSSSEDVIFTCDRTKLQPGINSATILLKSNDPDTPAYNINVLIRIPGIPANISALEGNIVDATFDKSTNTLYFVTGQPNKLVAYDVTAKTVLHEIALDKAPTCMAITEDFSEAMIGHGGIISVLNLNDFSATKTYETDFTIYDAEWAKDNWFCYTKSNDNSSVLFWINTSTDETYETKASWSFGTGDLKKVPGQPYIIGSRKNVSPSGIFVFDIETKNMKSYVHQSIGNLWFFDNGELAVTGYSEIMRTSVIISGSDNPPSIGELKTDTYAYKSWSVDFSPEQHSIWAIFSYYTHSYYPPENATIYQFEDNDYTLVKKYIYDNMFQPDAGATAYEVEAHYLFSNSSGTELSILRKGKDNNNWSIEFIPVQQ
jgi:hypothetical protein